MRAAAALAFAVALRMSLAGRGGSEDEVEEVDEAEDEEEVVDAGWAVMRAGLRAAASAAATAGRMEGMSPGCKLGAGGWGGPVVTWRPGGPIWSAAAGEGGAGLRPSLSGLGWAWVLQCAKQGALLVPGIPPEDILYIAHNTSIFGGSPLSGSVSLIPRAMAPRASSSRTVGVQVLVAFFLQRQLQE